MTRVLLFLVMAVSGWAQLIPFPGPGKAPTAGGSGTVTFDAVGPATGTSSGTQTIDASAGSYTTTWNHTLGSGASVVIVGIVMEAPDTNGFTSSATFNGSSMTPIPSSKVYANGGTAYGYVQLFGLSPVPAAGTYAIVVTTNHGTGTAGSSDTIAGSVSFKGATGWGAAAQTAVGGSGTLQVGVTSATGEMVIDVAQCGAGSIGTSAQAEQWRYNSGLNFSIASSTATGAASVTMGYGTCGDLWAISAVTVHP